MYIGSYTFKYQVVAELCGEKHIIVICLCSYLN